MATGCRAQIRRSTAPIQAAAECPRTNALSSIERCTFASVSSTDNLHCGSTANCSPVRASPRRRERPAPDEQAADEAGAGGRIEDGGAIDQLRGAPHGCASTCLHAIAHRQFADVMQKSCSCSPNALLPMINPSPADNSPWPTKSVDSASQGHRARLHHPRNATATRTSPALARRATCRRPRTSRPWRTIASTKAAEETPVTPH
ncbi:hypothetical protein SAMN04487925_102704 [Bradyrhizobium sp. cf659]|nr:hypothetical protein SAMN04487925_102704 [Bradyrhizobium sp. cf659]